MACHELHLKRTLETSSLQTDHGMNLFELYQSQRLTSPEAEQATDAVQGLCGRGSRRWGRRSRGWTGPGTTSTGAFGTPRAL